MKFKNLSELKQYVNDTSGTTVREPLRCHVCGRALVDHEGYTEFITQEDYIDFEFCSKSCIIDYLISMGYLEKEKDNEDI